MTWKQDKKYWRIWKAICLAQGWYHEPSAKKTQRRHALHESFNLPISHTEWHNKQFSRWIKATAHLCNQVDIRDRDRENAEWTIKHLSEAIAMILGKQPGEYEREILLDQRDSELLEAFPLEEEAGPAAGPNGKGHRDLDNLKKTLHNRLSRFVTLIKTGKLPRPELAAQWGSASNRAIIAALIAQKPVQAAPTRRKYELREFTPAPKDVGALPRRPSPPPAPPASADSGLKSQVSGFSYCTHAVPPKPATPAPIHVEADPF